MSKLYCLWGKSGTSDGIHKSLQIWRRSHLWYVFWNVEYKLAFWSDYMAFFWGGDTNSKSDQDFLPSVGPQIEPAVTEHWKQDDLLCLCYFLWHWMGTLQLFLAIVFMSKCLSWKVLFVLGIGSFTPENKYNKINWQRILLRAINIPKRAPAVII